MDYIELVDLLQDGKSDNETEIELPSYFNEDGYAYIEHEDEDWKRELVEVSRRYPLHTFIFRLFDDKKGIPFTDYYFSNGDMESCPAFIQPGRRKENGLPLKDEPPLGTVYYMPDFVSEQSYVQMTWQGSDTDRVRLQKGLVYLEEKGAAYHAKAACDIFLN